MSENDSKTSVPAQHWSMLLPLECQSAHWLITDENVHVYDKAYPLHHQESHGRVRWEELVSKILYQETKAMSTTRNRNADQITIHKTKNKIVNIAKEKNPVSLWASLVNKGRLPLRF